MHLHTETDVVESQEGVPRHGLNPAHLTIDPYKEHACCLEPGMAKQKTPHRQIGTSHFPPTPRSLPGHESGWLHPYNL